LFKSYSCPAIFEYIEDLKFDEHFELSLFDTKSERDLNSTVINLDFIKHLEIEQANRSIDNYILKIQSSIIATNIPEFIESASQTLGPFEVVSSSHIPTEPLFIPTTLV